jgi:hypothetical protein
LKENVVVENMAYYCILIRVRVSASTAVLEEFQINENILEEKVLAE